MVVVSQCFAHSILIPRYLLLCVLLFFLYDNLCCKGYIAVLANDKMYPIVTRKGVQCVF